MPPEEYRKLKPLPGGNDPAPIPAKSRAHAPFEMPDTAEAIAAWRRQLPPPPDRPANRSNVWKPHYSQNELVCALHICKHTLYSWERGVRLPPPGWQPVFAVVHDMAHDGYPLSAVAAATKQFVRGYGPHKKKRRKSRKTTTRPRKTRTP